MVPLPRAARDRGQPCLLYRCAELYRCARSARSRPVEGPLFHLYYLDPGRERADQQRLERRVRNSTRLRHRRQSRLRARSLRECARIPRRDRPRNRAPVDRWGVCSQPDGIGGPRGRHQRARSVHSRVEPDARLSSGWRRRAQRSNRQSRFLARSDLRSLWRENPQRRDRPGRLYQSAYLHRPGCRTAAANCI